MLVKVLGTIDIISGLIMIFSGAGINIQKEILIIIAIILVIKSLIGFFKDFASWIDLTAGIILLLSNWFPFLNIIVIILSILILQKGFVSFL